MNQQLNTGIQEAYPAWHEKPFRLTLAEISHPRKVVDDFFKQYRLSALRRCLEECLCATGPPDRDLLQFYFSFCREVEKALEALHVLHKSNYIMKEDSEEVEEPGAHRQEIKKTEDTAARNFFKEEYGTEKPVFNKERFYLDQLPAQPMRVLTRIFQSSMDDSLKSVVKKWQMVAIREEYFEYQEGQEVANLFIFCEVLQRLIEALYIICAAWCRTTQSDVLLFLNDEYLFLNKKEQANPYLVLNAFKQKFPYRHARAEVWDLMHAVVPYNVGNQRNASQLMEHFELLLCMIKAPYILKEEAMLLSAIGDLQTKNSKGVIARH